MTFLSHKKKLLTSILALSLLIAVVFIVSGCEELGLGGTTDEPTDTEETGVITSGEEAELAVYQHLLAQAESSKAKLYLSDFYTYSHDWSVQSEYFRDGSATWLVAVDMTGETDWAHEPHWQRAGWFVLKDGNVLPANLYQLNALRIEADLKALSDSSTTE
ncbi:MAG: hypothetical protein PVG61_04040 [Dehalococcoidia bacterium]|jgi:hypothetical protein